jgi:hypothetical protein
MTPRREFYRTPRLREDLRFEVWYYLAVLDFDRERSRRHRALLMELEDLRNTSGGSLDMAVSA